MTVQGSAENHSGRSWRTQEERRSEAENALLAAAAELFAERGIANTSLAAICELAGYSHGLVNHHFGSKAALVERLALHCQEKFVADLHAEEADTGMAAVLQVAMAYLDAFSPGDAFSRCFLVMWGAAFVAQSDETFAQTDERFRNGISYWVEKGKIDGSVAGTVDGEAFAAVLLAMVRGIAAQMLVSPDKVDKGKEKSEVSRLVRLALEGERDAG